MPTLFIYLPCQQINILILEKSGQFLISTLTYMAGYIFFEYVSSHIKPSNGEFITFSIDSEEFNIT